MKKLLLINTLLISSVVLFLNVGHSQPTLIQKSTNIKVKDNYNFKLDMPPEFVNIDSQLFAPISNYYGEDAISFWDAEVADTCWKYRDDLDECNKIEGCHGEEVKERRFFDDYMNEAEAYIDTVTRCNVDVILAKNCMDVNSMVEKGLGTNYKNNSWVNYCKRLLLYEEPQVPKYSFIIERGLMDSIYNNVHFNPLFSFWEHNWNEDKVIYTFNELINVLANAYEHEVEPKLEIDEDSFYWEDENLSFSMEIIGYGDLNDDGFQDVLLKYFQDWKGGALFKSDNFVITKLNEKGNFEVLR